MNSLLNTKEKVIKSEKIEETNNAIKKKEKEYKNLNEINNIKKKKKAHHYKFLSEYYRSQLNRVLMNFNPLKHLENIKTLRKENPLINEEFNEKHEAIYARQSVNKLDSISIESQIERCEKEVTCGNVKVYADRGYSGKNTERPEFRRLMSDIAAGDISRVIVYRLDRISRSVLDFAGMIDEFKKHRVDFVSTVEKFDTGTPVGNAMLMLIMIFAQLERETIQLRVTDAYAARSRRGFYMGGRTPYGFRLCETVIDGIHTKMLMPDEATAPVVKKIFDLYAQQQNSLDADAVDTAVFGESSKRFPARGKGDPTRARMSCKALGRRCEPTA